MPYKFELNKSFWSLNFSEPYQKLFDDFQTHVLQLPSYKKYLATQQEYNEAVKNYKTKHSPFKYGLVIFCLFFSWLGFIVLWFKNYAYYKKLKANKLALLKQVDEAKQVCLAASEAYAKEIDVSDFIKGIYDLLKYQEIGPINHYLYNAIMQNSGLDLTCNDTVNPYQSSWGIWDKNKIVFDMSMQEATTTMRTYTGSIMVPVRRGDEHTFVTLTATYVHPFSDVIIYPNRYYAYMQACDRLNFTFNKERKLKFLASKKHRLENSEFSKAFVFDYNDAVQYRMIFTPHKQEMMMNEYQLNKKDLASEDELNKTGPYLYTNYSTPANLDTLLFQANELLAEFRTNADFDIYRYLNKLQSATYDRLEDLFKALKHLFTTPIMYSENHKTIINHALNNHQYETYLPHYVLNKIINEEIVRYDSPCFNEILSNKTIKLSNGELHCCVMDGLSYHNEPRIIYLPPDFHAQGINHQLVPVHYIETVPYHEQMTFYYAPLVTTNTRTPAMAVEEILGNLNKTNQKNLNELLSEAGQKNIIFYLKENFVVAKLLNNQTYSESDIKTYFQDIIKLLKKK